MTTLRVLQNTARTLAQAHKRAVVHGRMRLDDVRGLPGALSTLDGWHREWAATAAMTQAADATSLVAPEVQLGREASPASDVFSVGRLAEQILGDVDGGAFTEADPSRRPGMDAVVAWLGRLKPERLVAPASRDPIVARAPEVRYEPLDNGRFRDVLLGREVELTPAGSEVDVARLLSAVARDGATWLVLRAPQ